MRKYDLLWFHIIITAVLMFGVAFLPAPEPITPVGMQMLGIFLGLIYGWSASSLIWPSFMGMLALLLTNCVSLKTFLSLSFANETVVFILFIFIFTTAVDKEGVTSFLANWCMSRKILLGRPWILSFGLLLGAALTGAVANMFAAIFIFWGILYEICKQVDIKPYEKYPTLMVLGIALSSIIGSCMLPYRSGPLIILGAYQSLTGKSVDFLAFMLFVIPLVLLTIIFYLAICRFVFRVDISALKSVTVDFIKPEELVMTKRQKGVLVFLGSFILLAIMPSLLPKTIFVAVLLNRIGTIGIMIMLLMIMLWVKVDGEPLANIQDLASKGMIWDMIFLFAIIFPLSGLLMGDDTGIKLFMVQTLQPLFSGISPLFFMISVLLVPTIITNFANNIVVAMIFIQIICSLAEPLGINDTPIIMTLMICINLAFYTPAASAPAAMVFGNVAWIKPKDIYTLGGIMMILLALGVILFGLLWGNVIF